MDGNAIYRYSDGRDGTVHWSGSTNDRNAPLGPERVPNEVLKEFGFKSKGSKSPW